MGQSAFTTKREKTLWAWTAVAVVAISLSLGLAQTLSDQLQWAELAEGTFGVAFLLIGLAIVVMALRFRPRNIEVGVQLGLLAVYTLVLVRMAIADERTHLIEYGIVAALAHEALVERRDHGRHVPVPALMAFAGTVLLGVVDELIQLLIPARVFDVEDMAANAIAAGMAVLTKVIVTTVSRRRSDIRQQPFITDHD